MTPVKENPSSPVPAQVRARSDATALLSIIVFVGCVGICLAGLISPQIALAIGIVFGMFRARSQPAVVRVWTTYLLQISVVGLGLTMDVRQVLLTGARSFAYSALTIGVTLALGWILGRLLKVGQRVSFLITVGTAICGGSAIAAVGPLLEATEEEMTVSLGTVFALNSAALFLFPAAGMILHMSQAQFGLWSALAIHDTSSVVGAAAKFGAAALSIATTAKLARALWIAPLAIGVTIHRRGQRLPCVPWFIGLFCVAAALNTYLPQGRPLFHIAAIAARNGLVTTLFLIGAGISMPMLRRVGPKPLLEGLLLWSVMGTVTLWLVLSGWINA